MNTIDIPPRPECGDVVPDQGGGRSPMRPQGGKGGQCRAVVRLWSSTRRREGRQVSSEVELDCTMVEARLPNAEIIDSVHTVDIFVMTDHTHTSWGIVGFLGIYKSYSDEIIPEAVPVPSI